MRDMHMTKAGEEDNKDESQNANANAAAQAQTGQEAPAERRQPADGGGSSAGGGKTKSTRIDVSKIYPGVKDRVSKAIDGVINHPKVQRFVSDVKGTSTYKSLSQAAKDTKRDTKQWLHDHPATQAGLRGAAIGAGAYSTLAIVRDILDAANDRKKKKKMRNPGISSDTLVITVPSKKASARDDIVRFAGGAGDDCDEGELSQARNPDGTYASGWDMTFRKRRRDCDSVKQADSGSEEAEATLNDYGYWDTIGNRALGGFTTIGGLGIGWVAAQRLHDMLKQKRLKREIAAAQKEYIDILGLSVDEKKAEAGDDQPQGSPFDQVAPGMPPTLGTRVRNTLSGISDGIGGFTGDAKDMSANLLGIAGTTGLLIIAASTYLTKKFMDKKFNEGYTATSIHDRPKVNNIVFKTASGREIGMDPVDLLATVKFASMLMTIEPTSDSVEKKAAAPVGGINYGSYIDAILNHAGIDPEADPSNISFGDKNLENLVSENKGLMSALYNGLSSSPDTLEGLIEAFQDNKYRNLRSAIARNTIKNWYENTSFNNSALGKYIRRPMGYILGMLSDLLSGTRVGSRIMGRQMYDRLGKAVVENENAVPENEPEDTGVGFDDPEPAPAPAPAAPEPAQTATFWTVRPAQPTAQSTAQPAQPTAQPAQPAAQPAQPAADGVTKKDDDVQQ